ncbi:hypothetical protein QVD17_14682 [Tagetes erecta]|uniref:Uncharacterized protein n=1 Tax=Tagetes erecta TaxID=13708 RepID=A0AAD8NRV9_TARER|nr:hypothetical protein QVD17_14682 [Tagetes erecta]
MADGDGDDNEALPPGVSVSKFDFSVENHFKVMDEIATCSGESEIEYEQTEVQRLSSSVTFLRKWRDFRYQSRSIRFAWEDDNSQEKDVTAQIKLPQFSSVAVCKDMSDGNSISSPSSKDSVMYVGGHVWALDWCPRVHQSSTFDTNVEFIAVSAHPPESSYNKIGDPLTGRGLLQIWCVLNTAIKDGDLIPSVKVNPRKASINIDPTKSKKPRGRPKKNPINEMEDDDQSKQDLSVQSPDNASNLLQLVSIEENDKNFNSIKPKKPRGRPRKKPMNGSLSNIDGGNKHIQPLTGLNSNSPKTIPQPLAIDFPVNSPELRAIDKFTLLTNKIFAKKQVTRKVYKVYTRRPKDYNKGHSAMSTWISSSPKLTKCQTKRNNQVNGSDLPILSQNRGSPFGQDAALPRLVMGLAHNGKVARDVKWRPSCSSPISKHIMGYLAVLLGNGSLEVWEVPRPNVIKTIYSSRQLERTDPRFLKLKPVFLCSLLKCGDRQSIPLTLEWSTSAPHDLILAGCHDGLVALWRFSADGPCKDTRPLLCFNADTGPIRALKWAPMPSDPESANTVVTASHKSVKFWDIRDPFHPLWKVPVSNIINSLDWVPDPSCVVLSFDHGEIQIINLSMAACDTPVTGMLCTKKEHCGSCRYYCSPSSIWSVQVSRLTGMVAYCCSDGTAIHFQLTTKALEKNACRNRESHYLCGSLREEGSTLTLLFPLPNVPFRMKKSSTEWSDKPTSKRHVSVKSNQEKRARELILKCQKRRKLLSDNDSKSKEEYANEEIEVLPPKIVATHRVRWNMNKGSERWLCSGGAAGIIWCQEIK